MSTVQAWAVLLGLITPFLVAFVARPTWSPSQKRYLSVGVAVIVGAINLFVQGLLSNFSWEFGSVVNNIVLVLGASQAAYSLLWKPTGISDKVEQVTSPSTS